MKSAMLNLLGATLVCTSALVTAAHSAEEERSRVQAVVDGVIPTLMEQQGIPGMAVGVITPDGNHLFQLGVSSKETRTPVTTETLFEIGSISKTFTATLVSYAALQGKLALTDIASDHLPALHGSPLGKASLLSLATHTPGGMPLQFPEEVTDEASMMTFFREWEPTYEPGTYRTYANPSIGLLGVIAAASMGGDFATLMQDRLFPALGLEDTYLKIPEAVRDDYAQGYTKTGEPRRMAPGVLDDEAYGVRTTAADLVRFVETNMGRIDLEDTLQKAIIETHTGYYKLGAMTQDLIWEQYVYPIALEDLLAGTSPNVSQKPNPVIAITPPLAPRKDVFIHKTGSTSGFGAYVAFIPEQQLGIVLLANKNYPNDARVTAGHAILQKLAEGVSSNQ
jgi:beta-lactamase class C